MKKALLLSCLLVATIRFSYSQGCCSGGAGSPIAGGAASGVLLNKQMEVSASYQFINSNKFKTNNNRDTTSIINDTLTSHYLFLRTDYGLSEKLTISLAMGYFQNKSLINANETYST